MSVETLKYMPNDDLYTEFKEHLNRWRLELEEDTDASSSAEKQALARTMSEIYRRPGALNLVFSKQIDERFWSVLKQELRVGESRPCYQQILDENKLILVSLLKTAWQSYSPLSEPHTDKSPARKICSRILVSIAEVVKLKAKFDNALLGEVKDLLSRSQRLYSHAGRTQELLGMCYQQFNDIFGGIYWISRSLSCVEPTSNTGYLLHLYEELSVAWNQFSLNMPQKISRPNWYVGLCLSFLKVQGGFFIGFLESQETMDMFTEYLQVFLEQREEPYSSLLQSMVHLWIFSIHHTANDDFDKEVSDLSKQAFNYFSKFLNIVIDNVHSENSPWTGAVVTLYYWLLCYPKVKDFISTEELRSSLRRLSQRIRPKLDINSSLCIAEDMANIGFAPLQQFYSTYKSSNLAIGDDEVAIKTVLLNGLIEKMVEKKKIVIDAISVAIRHGGGQFSARGVEISIDYFISNGYECVAVIPEQCLIPELASKFSYKGFSPRKVSIDTERLRELDRKGLLEICPAGDKFEGKCIEFARSQGAMILTNDRYWDYLKCHPENKEWLRNNECSFKFNGDIFVPAFNF